MADHSLCFGCVPVCWRNHTSWGLPEKWIIHQSDAAVPATRQLPDPGAITGSDLVTLRRASAGQRESIYNIILSSNLLSRTSILKVRVLGSQIQQVVALNNFAGIVFSSRVELRRQPDAQEGCLWPGRRGFRSDRWQAWGRSPVGGRQVAAA